MDDEADLRAAIRGSLETGGHEVVEAADGMLALESVQSNRPDLIISDIEMPRMGGDEFFDALRGDDTGLHMIPFIFLSAHANDEEILRRLNGGANNCFRKPFSMKMLLAHVNSCVSNSERFSQFMAGKLDEISNSMLRPVGRDFRPYRSLVENLDAYASVIALAVRESIPVLETEMSEAGPIENGSGARHDERTARKGMRIKFVQGCLARINELQALGANSQNDALTWQIVYLVAESQMLQKAIYVSDLYFSAKAARTTVNSRINALIRDEIFKKESDKNDARRQRITLTGTFATLFEAHIDDSIQQMADFHRGMAGIDDVA